MTKKSDSSPGFTIVELLIVIVVIGILAAITIVAYNGIQSRATIASLQSNLEQAGKQFEAYKLLTSGSNQYPADLAAANLNASSDTTYSYTALSPSSGTNTAYCLTAVNNTYQLLYDVGVTKPDAGHLQWSGRLVANEWQRQ